MVRRGESPQRLLTTVLFTDIVGSRERAAQLGDRGWKDLVAREVVPWGPYSVDRNTVIMSSPVLGFAHDALMQTIALDQVAMQP